MAVRLNPEHLLELVDERYEFLCGRSSLAVKTTKAALRISFARFNSATSARSFLISSASFFWPRADPHEHQRAATEVVGTGESYVLTTGTGFGK
ncbi:hypothetical protein [Actinocorallia libanotica]|uniref:hypothetical protein n=1 Tax=Actinocorallia libanotica TaxID=46162 RepID=UPI003CD08E2D